MRALMILGLAAACGRLDFTPMTDASARVADGIEGDTSVASCEGFDICEDFEDAIDPLWLVDPGLSLDSSIAHRGGQSARMHLAALPPDTDGAARIYETVTLAPVPTEVWIRAWVRMGALPASGNDMELIAIEHNGGGPAGDYVFARADTVLIYANAQGTVSATGMPFALDTWTCLVFHVVFSTTVGGSLALDIDDVPALVLPSTITDDSGFPVDMLGIGPHFASTNIPNPQPALDVWIDDVIVHSSSVTCSD
jgi:hypothetical protein